MNAANRSMSFWKLADGLAVFSETSGVLSFGVTLNWQAGSLSRSFWKSSLVMPISTL
jgi:hypothetical protein